MQRPVVVRLGLGDVIVELLRERGPQVVDDAERGVAILDRVDEDGDVPRTHNLADLWNTAEPLLQKIEPGSSTTYADVRTCLAKFTAMDPGSETFRYPVTAAGAPTLPEDLYHLDLKQLREVVERLSGFLDGASEQALVYLDYKAEMASYYGGYGEY